MFTLFRFLSTLLKLFQLSALRAETRNNDSVIHVSVGVMAEL